MAISRWFADGGIILIGKIQERYGIVKQEAGKQVDEFAQSFRNEDSSREIRPDNQGRGEHTTSGAKKRGAGQS
jgi:hypothetical protein